MNITMSKLTSTTLAAVYKMFDTQTNATLIAGTIYAMGHGGKLLIIHEPKKLNIHSEHVMFTYRDGDGKDQAAAVRVGTWEEINKLNKEITNE